MNRNSLLPLLAIVCAGTLAAQDTTVISGRALGADGRPLPKAHVAVARPNWRTPLELAEVAADGNFRITTTSTGLLMVRVTGVGHRPCVVPVVIDAPGPIQLDVRLGTYGTGRSPDSAWIVGDFNSFDQAEALPMARGTDGAYRSTIRTYWDSLAYQIVLKRDRGGAASSIGETDDNAITQVSVKDGIVTTTLTADPFAENFDGDVLINGTQSDEYAYDGNGGYRSIVATPDSSITVVFDPKGLPSSGAVPAVTYGTSPLSRVAAIIADIRQRRKRADGTTAPRLVIGGGRSGAAYNNWPARSKELLAHIQKETDPMVRGALRIAYIDGTVRNGGGIDREMARALLSDLPPGSPLWEIDPPLVDMAIAGTKDEAAFGDYRWRMVESLADTSRRALVLLQGIIRARENNQPELSAQYYTYLLSHYPATYLASYARSEYNPDPLTKVGKKVPHFELSTIDDPADTVSDTRMLGRYYLIDFWGTWCGPCIAEMEYLHAAYERFGGPKFEIISLARDNAKAIEEFRGKKWKMPWKHAAIGSSMSADPVSYDFEVAGIPHALLINDVGTIVAVGDELRGVSLERTLARFLDDAR